MAPSEKGTCLNSMKRFAYSIIIAKCVPFDYRLKAYLFNYVFFNH